jgi:hypothetical protein
VRDTVVKLLAETGFASTEAKPVLAAVVGSVPAVTPPDDDVVRFAIRISSHAPQGQCRLRLWDAFGREPRVVGRDWEFYGRTDLVVPLERAAKDVHGHTLTWSVRLAPFEAEAGERYELLTQILQSGTALPNASFSYSGPLDDLDQVAGRFHFVVEKPPGGPRPAG